MKDISYSWVLPIKDEAEALPQLFFEIVEAMEKSRFSAKGFEVIAVNDASTDETKSVLKEKEKELPQLRHISLQAHQGKWAALAAGFTKAQGDIIITLDSDLQDDAGEVKKLLDKLDQGYDVVSGWRKDRHDPYYKVAISRLGNWLASLLTWRAFKDVNSPFKVYRREVIESLPRQGSMLRFSLLFADKLGYRVAEVPVKHRPRRFGRSKFGIVKYIRIIYDLVLVLLLFSGSGRIAKN